MISKEQKSTKGEMETHTSVPAAGWFINSGLPWSQAEKGLLPLPKQPRKKFHFFFWQFYYMPEIKPSASLISFTRCAVEMDQEGLALPWQAGDLEMGACPSPLLLLSSLVLVWELFAPRTASHYVCGCCLAEQSRDSGCGLSSSSSTNNNFHSIYSFVCYWSILNSWWLLHLWVIIALMLC